MEMRSGNPALRTLALCDKGEKEAMAWYGVRIKATFLSLLSVSTALAFWELLRSNIVGDVIEHGLGWLVFLSPFFAYLFYWLANKRPTLAIWFGPLYAIAIGVLFGTYSGLAEMKFPGIVIHIVVATLSTYLTLLAAYIKNVVSPNARYMNVIIWVVLSFLSLSCIDLALTILVGPWRSIYSYGPVAIAANVMMVVVAAMVAIFDFQFIDETIKSQVSRDMEWYAAIAIVSGVLWIYVGLLFLVTRLRRS